MNKAIVIGTMSGREAWLKDCMASLHGCTVPIWPVESPNFELSVIEKASHQFEEFIFIPDSTEVIDVEALTSVCFDTPHSVSLSDFPCPFGMYLGKYISKQVLATGVPTVENKFDAVRYESAWTKRYTANGEYIRAGNLPHSDVFVTKHGRLNMVCENHLLRRYKASWNAETMQREHQRIVGANS